MNTLTQLRRLGLFDARVPRYTSYPTANHFTSAVGAEDAARWIAEIPEGSGISLYVHVPFCRRLCWFCACRTQGTVSAAPVNGYLDIVARELAMVAERLPRGVHLSRVHWGGGTPTLMQADRITDLARRIGEMAPMADDAEFSVEIDPNEIDDARLDALAAAGLTRASIGVQDFDQEIQATIGRPQSFEITKTAADAVRARGIESLNVDLLYGLPHQTPRRISDSVQKVLSLAPERVALYGYAHVPWMARRQSMIPSEALPYPEARLELYETARQLFIWDGYEEVGIDHFARPGDGLVDAARAGRLGRNFQGYTDDDCDVLIGIGASAISRFPQGYAQNNAATSGYHGSIAEGRFATTRGHAYSIEDKLRADLITDLMCRFRIDFAEIAERHGELPANIAARLNGIAEAFPGMVALDATSLRIPPQGRPLARMIARFIDEYASPETAHSAAI